MLTEAPTDRYVQVGTIRTRYWVMGEGTPPVILLHGLGGYTENWRGNLAALAQVRRVYALDIVGFGRTDKPRVEYSVPYVTEFVHEFMVAQRIDRVALVGESMGGGIALCLALQYPDQVEKLVVADSAGLGREMSPFFRIMSLPILGEFFSRPSRKGSGQLLQVLFQDQGVITDQAIEENYQMASLPEAQRCLLSVLRSGANAWGARSETYRPVLDRLGEIKIPTLVIWGAQDGILPVALAHRAAKRLPNARLHIFDPCGHVPNVECAPEYNALVTDFMAHA